MVWAKYEAFWSGLSELAVSHSDVWGTVNIPSMHQIGTVAHEYFPASFCLVQKE